jgi:hypothetical protein
MLGHHERSTGPDREVSRRGRRGRGGAVADDDSLDSCSTGLSNNWVSYFIAYPDSSGAERSGVKLCAWAKTSLCWILATLARMIERGKQVREQESGYGYEEDEVQPEGAGSGLAVARRCPKSQWRS